MSDTICGHERGILRRAIQGWILAPSTTQYITEGGGDFSLAERAARSDANDPAKLAEMMAIEGLRLQVPATYEARDNGVTVRLIEIGLPLPIYCFRTISSARAIIDVWLGLHDGATEQALDALRGAT